MPKAMGQHEYLTPSVIADFSSTGMQTLLEVLQTPELLEDIVCDTASQIFTEVLMLVQNQDLPVETVIVFMKQAISDELRAIIFCQVFDVFPPESTLVDLVIRLHKDEAIINASTLAQHVDWETLVKLDIVPVRNLTRQMNTRKRDEFFTQKKFNLLHEEFEGYSAVINEFNSIFGNEENEFLVDYAVNVAQLLIGHYLLDPNRVLDILIDMCANNIVGNHRFIINFFKRSPWWPQTEGNCKEGLDSLNLGGNSAVVSVIALRLSTQIQCEQLQALQILIALFIKEGFISFGQIYSYFLTSDQEMCALEAAYKKELEERVFQASASALALAAPLLDEEKEPSSDKPSRSPSSSSQESVEILKKNNMKFQMLKCFLGNGLYWPSIYILSHYPFLVHIDSEVSGLMHRLLSAIINPLHLTLIPFNDDQMSNFRERKLFATLRPLNKVRFSEVPVSKLYSSDPLAAANGKEVDYFITEWSSEVPTLKCADDLISISREFLKFFASTLVDSQSNFIKICEIIAADLRADPSEENKGRWLGFFRNYILPNLGFIAENAIPVDKAYEILSFFSVDDRFNLYGELYQVVAKNNPHVKIAYGKAEKSTKDVLKRLSKENIEPMKRRLAKISLSNPLVCFLTILQQLESYDNLNTLVVETAAYFNDYGWDNMTLAIMMRLTSTGRSNKQANGLNERQWIQSLSSFIGKLCQKYPHSFDLETLLKYLLLSFHSSGCVDLIVFKEILSSMGGVQSITNLTLLQIDMINCEPSMQKIVYKTIGDKRFEYHGSGSRLREALVNDGSINEFFVLFCKISSELIDSSDINHLKVLTSARDELDSVLHLLCTLIGFFGNDCLTLLPIDVLISEYNVPVAWAFELWRNLLSDINIDTLHPQIKKALPEGYLGQTRSEIFTLFWKMNLYDLNFSPEMYDSELSKLKSRILSLKEEYSFARKDKSASQQSLDVMKKGIAELEALSLAIPSEKESHKSHSKVINEYFTTFLNQKMTVYGPYEAKNLLQLCVLPRAVHSSFDAIYSAEFIFQLHKTGVSGYSLMTTLDVMFENRVFFATLFTSTPLEAENLGIFVSAILKELNLWTEEKMFSKISQVKHLWKEGCAGHMTYSSFKKSIFDYHTLLLNDVSRALKVTTYMSRMNAITFLKNLLGVYPIVEDHCEAIIELIDDITHNETRDDLKLSSSALIGHVKSRKNSWVHLWDFIDLDESEKIIQIQKRKKIQDCEDRRLAEEARKKSELQRLEERKSQKEEQYKKNVEKAESQEGPLPPSISYDDQDRPAARFQSRNIEVIKGRYDSYSSSSDASTGVVKNSGKPAIAVSAKPLVDSSKEQKNIEPTGPVSTKTRHSTSDEELKSKEPNTHGGLSDDLFQGKTERLNQNKDNAPLEKSQLKTRLEQARKEYSSKANVDTRDATNPRANAERRDTSNPRANVDTRDATNPRANAERRDTSNPRANVDTRDATNPRANVDTRDATNPRANVDTRDATNPRANAERRDTTNPRANVDTRDATNPRANAERRDATNSRVSDRQGSSTNTSRSTTPIVSGHTQTAPSSSSSSRQSGLAKTGGNEDLGPSRTASPNTSVKSSSTSVRSANMPNKRPSLPPQVAPRDGKFISRFSSENKSSLSLQQGTRGPSRALHQPSGPSGKNRLPLPPQQPPRDKSSFIPSLDSRTHKASAMADERNSTKRFVGRDRRPSGDPLPPPSLPPPTRAESSNRNGPWDRKRKFEGGGRSSDKRLRY